MSTINAQPITQAYYLLALHLNYYIFPIYALPCGGTFILMAHSSLALSVSAGSSDSILLLPIILCLAEQPNLILPDY